MPSPLTRKSPEVQPAERRQAPVAEPAAAHGSITAAWEARVAGNPDGIAVRYFDGTLTAHELDRASDALAAALQQRGTAHGDRVGIYLQNIPQYVIALLALWKLGAVAVIINPMYRHSELRRLVDDSGASGIICADTAAAEAGETLAGSTVRWVITTSARDYQTRNDPRAFPPHAGTPEPPPEGDLAALIRTFDGVRPAAVELSPDDVALLTYTSGTTGPPKGAMNTHGNVLSVASSFADWAGIRAGDVVLAVAPLFHITGAVINGAVSLITDTALVFTGRFHPEVVLDAFAEHGVTYTIGSITVFNALLELPRASAAHFASAKFLYSGGAPIPPASLERVRERFGIYLHNAYGMTETTSGVIAVPAGSAAPVDPASGTLSIGKALPGITARVISPDGKPAPPGSPGELELSGPQIVPGYWRNPEASEHAMPGGRLRTGDVALMDPEGWIYLVDRLKDQINVSGYKVWPREVEDVLYQHAAVLEAAVIGKPDPYSGEAVVAYVSLKSSETASEAELVAFARERLAAYKYPRTVRILPALPKTQTGKIRRRELRDATAGDAPTAASTTAAATAIAALATEQP